jgi:hypothetical protein
MTSKTKRLLFLAVTAMALVLATAPVSFAGESGGSPGPTQVGETTVPVTTPAPATSPAPQAPAAPAASTPAQSTGGVAAVTKTTVKKDTVKAKGGIQAGYGGMATQSSSLPMELALGIGLLFILTAAVGSTPLVRRSRD